MNHCQLANAYTERVLGIINRWGRVMTRRQRLLLPEFRMKFGILSLLASIESLAKTHKMIADIMLIARGLEP